MRAMQSLAPRPGVRLRLDADGQVTPAATFHPCRPKRASLRDAAAAVLAVWDNEPNRAGDTIAALDAPMEALRDALARKPGRPMRHRVHRPAVIPAC